MFDIDGPLLLAYAIALPTSFLASVSSFPFARLVIRQFGLSFQMSSALVATLPLIIVVIGLKVLSALLSVPAIHMGIAFVAGAITGRFWADRRAIAE